MVSEVSAKALKDDESNISLPASTLAIAKKSAAEAKEVAEASTNAAQEVKCRAEEANKESKEVT